MRLRELARRLPEPVKAIARAVRRADGFGAMRIGRIASSTPMSMDWGYDRGTPIDRYYIEAFLGRHQEDIKGRVLEVQEDDYSRRFGGSRITRQDILNIDASNPSATIIGDLADPATLPEGQFDCIVLTQTLHLVFDMEAAVANVHRALRRGGVALITVPGISLVGPRGDYPWYWSLTEEALHRLLAKSFSQDKLAVETFGNLFAATAFLHAAAVEEVSARKLDRVDPSYPVTVTARAQK